MSRHRRGTYRRDALRVALVGLCAVVAVGGWALGRRAPAEQPVRPVRAVAAPPASSTPVILGAAPSHAVVPPAVGVPLRLQIPAIDVDAAMTSVALRPDGTLTEPPRWEVPAWYSGGPRPGAVGPAVIAGHVDSYAGPAVFFRLRDLRAGDGVVVIDSLGLRHQFVVDTVMAYSKDRFPTDVVYGPQPLPVLRLITCTGGFDTSARSYVDNLVVFAHLA